jgi:hypothetical protein
MWVSRTSSVARPCSERASSRMNGDGAQTQIGCRQANAMAISPRFAIRSLVMGMLFLARYRRQLHGLG